jgi:uncharacterized membrane protein YsdA (DUF1294 family)
MSPLLITILSAVVMSNVVAFGIMLYDKRLSTKPHSTDRIPEGVMFFMAALFGSVGIYAGMFLLRHKTRKWYFLIGTPLLCLQNTVTLYVLYKFIEQ